MAEYTQELPSIRPDDAAYVRDLHAAMLAQAPSRMRWALYLIAALLMAFFTWAHFATVEEITQGSGKVIATSGEQVIQSLDGGVLAELDVKEGQVVDKGQVLLKIDPTRAKAAFQEDHSKMLALEGTVARLQAAAYGQPLAFPPEVRQHPDIVRSETAAYNARKTALEENVAGLRRGLQLAEQEIRLTEPLVHKGLVSDLELLKNRRQANDLRIQISEAVNKYRTDANAELVQRESELAQARDNAMGRADALRRTVIRAPMRGTVKNIHTTTIGGVIQPASDIMEIVPLGDQLVVETKIRPKDVAFLRPGLPATVKITAYDYSIYGGLHGSVERISADTIKDDHHPVDPVTGGDNSYYKVLVRTTSSVLKAGGKSLPIIPGMTTTVEIRSGKRTVLDYLLKPVFKAREAFRER